MRPGWTCARIVKEWGGRIHASFDEYRQGLEKMIRRTHNMGVYYKVNCRIHSFGLGEATAYGYGIDLETNAFNPIPGAYLPPIATHLPRRLFCMSKCERCWHEYAYNLETDVIVDDLDNEPLPERNSTKVIDIPPPGTSEPPREMTKAQKWLGRCVL